MPSFGRLWVALVLGVVLGWASCPAFSQDTYSAAFASNAAREKDPALARYGGAERLESLSFSPRRLQGGSSLLLISPERWEGLAQRVSLLIEKVHHEYNTLFGQLPPLAASVRLLDRDAFIFKTGAPTWTNALYFRGEIMIPLSEREKLDTLDLVRSLRHEYLHAVVHSLSGGRCPGWLDEGLAQWIEGSENPALSIALARWLAVNPPVPLALLQGGFTKLSIEMVPAAYAQSLYAAGILVENFGFKPIRSYLNALKGGAVKADAFSTNFGLPESAFERSLTISLKEWKDKEPKRVK